MQEMPGDAAPADAAAAAPADVPASSEGHAKGEEHAEAVYDEVQLDEMDHVPDDGMYYYQCPCGDVFELSEVRARGAYFFFGARG